MEIRMKNKSLKTSLKELRSFSEELGYFPTTTEWNIHALNKHLTAHSIIRNTGKTWEEIRKEMGFKPKNRRCTKEGIIMAIKKAAEENNGHAS